MFMKIDLKMFAMKTSTVCVKVGNCILACCQTFTSLTDFEAAEICYGLSSIHRRNVRGQSDSCWSALVLLAY